MESWTLRTLVFVFQHPSSARSWSRAGRLWDHRIGTPTTLTFVVSSPQHCDLDGFGVTLSWSFSRLLLLDTIDSSRLHIHWHVDNLVARVGPVESLARSDFGHVHVLATQSHGYQVDSSCFDHSPVVPSRVKAGLGSVTLISSTLSSFNSLIAS